MFGFLYAALEFIATCGGAWAAYETGKSAIQLARDKWLNQDPPAARDTPADHVKHRPDLSTDGNRPDHFLESFNEHNTAGDLDFDFAEEAPDFLDDFQLHLDIRLLDDELPGRDESKDEDVADFDNADDDGFFGTDDFDFF